MKLIIKETKKNIINISKQGPCGLFCFKYWLGSGCDDNCTEYKIKNKYLII